MIDVKLLRENLQATAKKLLTRQCQLDTDLYQQLETKRQQLQTQTENLQAERNTKSKQIGLAKRAGEPADELFAQVNQINQQIKDQADELTKVQQQLNDIHLTIPNIPDESVPLGETEAENVVVRKWGEPKQFPYPARDHVELGEMHGLMDFAAAAKLTGARFVVLKRDLVTLHRALIQLMLDVHTQQHGYEEIYVPYIVNAETLIGTGQLPKFAEDQFALKGEHAYYLIPTAEVPVTNLARDKIFNEDQLPQKFACHTPCFRSEAGSYGKDTRGMIRQHQFEKVELVHLVKPEDSYAALEELTNNAEKILQLLNLPYQLLTLCTGDMGFAAAKTYDLEVWLPGQNRYREISSCSNATDFQARRLQARYRQKDSKKPQLIHTLNGSGLAVGRTLIAIMENYQNEDGSITIPEVLQPYMHEKKTMLFNA